MGEISQDSQELWDSNKKQKTDVCVSGEQLRRAICVDLFEFWGFYITRLRKRAVVNHSMLYPLLPQLRNLVSGLGWFHEPSITVWPGDPEICAVSILHLIMQGRDKKVKVCWVPLALLDHIASSHWLAVLGTHPVTGTWGGFYWGRDQYRVIMGHPTAQLSCLKSGAGALGLLFRKTNPTSIIGRDIIPFTGSINFTTGPTKPSILYYFLYKRWNKTFLHKD